MSKLVKTTVLIGALTTALIFGGCSDNNNLTNPNILTAEGNLENVMSLDNSLNGDIYAPPSFGGEDGITRITFVGTLEPVTGYESNVSCWYLIENESGEIYTPLFTGDTPKYYAGFEIEVTGYVDPNISSACQSGPVFCIESFKNTNLIFEEIESTGNSNDIPAIGGTELSIPENKTLELKGDFWVDLNERFYITNEEEGFCYELELPGDIYLPDHGSRIVTIGWFSAASDTESTSFVFHVQTLKRY